MHQEVTTVPVMSRSFSVSQFDAGIKWFIEIRRSLKHAAVVSAPVKTMYPRRRSKLSTEDAY